MNEKDLLQTVANHSTPSSEEVSNDGAFPLNEAKVIFVGEAGVCKTSLIARLTEKTFKPHENITEGIDIKSWLLDINDQSIKLDLWDFGGQEIYHATHQLFLTRRTLYLLVLNNRVSEEEIVIEPGTLFWFNNKLPHEAKNIGNEERIRAVWWFGVATIRADARWSSTNYSA
jgi:GTPase SAR1 family protein